LLCTHIQHQPQGNEAVVIDGDRFREIFKQTDYSPKGRKNNIRAANTVATYISQVNNVDVILALVNPYERLRAELRTNNSQMIEILLESDRDLRRDHHVDNFEVGAPEHIINTDSPADDTWNLLRKLLEL
jgi:adenylylsulfate kinase-like enzyme